LAQALHPGHIGNKVFVAMVKYGLDVRKGGTPIRRERALGLSWETGSKCMKQGGDKGLQAAGLLKLVLKGGHLQQRVDGAWRRRTQLTINMTTEDAELITDLVEMDWLSLISQSFNVTAVDEKMKAGLGFHDALGFFTEPQKQATSPGLITCEKKILKAWCFEKKLENWKGTIAERFRELQKVDERVTGQLFSCSKLHDTTIVSTSLYFLNAGSSKWQRLCHVCHVSSSCSVLFSKMNWFKATSGCFKGLQVASVGSFLKKAGKNGSQAGEKVKMWGDGSIAGVSKTCFPMMQLKQQRGGKGHVTTKAVFAKVHAYFQRHG
jgi:hypothetical protein